MNFFVCMYQNQFKRPDSILCFNLRKTIKLNVLWIDRLDFIEINWIFSFSYIEKGSSCFCFVMYALGCQSCIIILNRLHLWHSQNQQQQQNRKERRKTENFLLFFFSFQYKIRLLNELLLLHFSRICNKMELQNVQLFTHFNLNAKGNFHWWFHF